jgi:hypothetical protein
MIMGINTDGRNRLSRILVNGSNTEYETKNIDSVALYFPVLMLCKLFCRPSIFAFPMLVRSRKARR